MRSWTRGLVHRPQRLAAFESYRAALEREEQAALVYAVSTNRLFTEGR